MHNTNDSARVSRVFVSHLQKRVIDFVRCNARNNNTKDVDVKRSRKREQPRRAITRACTFTRTARETALCLADAKWSRHLVCRNASLYRRHVTKTIGIQKHLEHLVLSSVLHECDSNPPRYMIHPTNTSERPRGLSAGDGLGHDQRDEQHCAYAWSSGNSSGQPASQQQQRRVCKVAEANVRRATRKKAAATAMAADTWQKQQSLALQKMCCLKLFAPEMRCLRAMFTWHQHAPHTHTRNEQSETTQHDTNHQEQASKRTGSTERRHVRHATEEKRFFGDVANTKHNGRVITSCTLETGPTHVLYMQRSRQAQNQPMLKTYSVWFILSVTRAHIAVHRPVCFAYLAKHTWSISHHGFVSASPVCTSAKCSSRTAFLNCDNKKTSCIGDKLQLIPTISSRRTSTETLHCQVVIKVPKKQSILFPAGMVKRTSATREQLYHACWLSVNNT